MFINQPNKAQKKITRSQIKALIEEADMVLIGAAAGMSVPAGINYFDTAFFKKHFYPLTKKGYSYQYELVGGGGLSPEEGMAAMIRTYETQYRDLPVGQNYLDLKNVIKDKPYFVITTNVDSQFYKAGYDKNRIYTPQGAYHMLQCSRPCHDELYPVADFYEHIMAHFDAENFRVERSGFPRCPKCGEEMRFNLRAGMWYVDQPYAAGKLAYEEFVADSIDKKLLLLELGVGYNTPGIIRHPFEKMSYFHPDALLVRLNLSQPQLDDEENPKAFGFSVDLGQFFKE